MDAEHLLGLLIIRLDIRIADWPSGRDAGLMFHSEEIALSEPVERGAVKFCLSADITNWLLPMAMNIRNEKTDRIGRLTRRLEIVALLDNQRLQAALAEPAGETGATKTAADDDGVVGLRQFA